MYAADALAYIAGTMLVLWGSAHLGPTRAGVESLGPISLDNRRIQVMEWVAEGVTHIALGIVVILVTATLGSGDAGARLIDRSFAAVLLVLAGVTAVTGARTGMVWFRVCPVVLGSAAVLLVVASAVA